MSDALSFAEARDWHPEPAPDSAPDPPADTMAVALRLLVAIAEDPMLRASYRVAARRHIKRLERQAAS